MNQYTGNSAKVPNLTPLPKPGWGIERWIWLGCQGERVGPEGSIVAFLVEEISELCMAKGASGIGFFFGARGYDLRCYGSKCYCLAFP
jgi:hypothetical protein